MTDDFAHFLAAEGLPSAFRDTIARAVRPVATWLIKQRRQQREPIIVGIAGAQGSGKTTYALALAAVLSAQGLRAVVLSLDDFYLTRAQRERLAASIHPLFITRGVPGTHDIELGLGVLDRLTRLEPVDVPRFDKARDERRPPKQWSRVQAPVDVVLFEGWCMAARPQSNKALLEPVNELERECDADGRWRGHVNAALAGPYQTLFSRLHRLILLAAPGFDVVYRWRCEQEHKLAARNQGTPSRVMSDAQIARFIAHYERLTRHMLVEMPARADILVPLDERRAVQGVLIR